MIKMILTVMKEERIKLKRINTSRNKRRIYIPMKITIHLLKVKKRLKNMFYSWT
jgi:hypothetical protein